MPNPDEIRLYQEIVVYATNKNFLNIYDALDIDKVKVALAEYGTKGYNQAVVWLDRDEILFLIHMVIFGMFKTQVMMPGQKAVPGKWEKFSGSEKDGKIESRTFSLEYDPGENNAYGAYPYRLTVANGPGRKSDSGAVMPAGQATAKVSFRLPAFDLINILLQVQAHLQADTVIGFAKRRARNLEEQKKKLLERQG